MKIIQRIIVVVALLATVFCLSSCEDFVKHDYVNGVFACDILPAGMRQIPNKPNFIYYEDTGIIYMLTYIQTEGNESCFGIIPYISINGKYCRYVDNKVIEVN